MKQNFFGKDEDMNSINVWFWRERCISDMWKETWWGKERWGQSCSLRMLRCSRLSISFKTYATLYLSSWNFDTGTWRGRRKRWRLQSRVCLLTKHQEPKLEWSTTGRLRLNLNPLNLMRWIDSWPFDKTWKPGWNDSTWVNWFNGRAMNLEWIFIMIPSRARKSFSKASPYIFLQHLYGLSTVTTGTDSMPFDYLVWFQKIRPNDIHSMMLLHF